MVGSGRAEGDLFLATVEKVLTLLDKKAGLFTEYEKATQDLLVCEADDVEKYIIERGRLANEIDEVTEEIGFVCDGEPNGEVIFSAASAKINYDRVPPELRSVFESGQNVRSIAARILETDKQVTARLEGIRDEAKEKIRQNQNMPKIKKYLTDLTEKPGEGGLKSGKA